MTRIFLRRGTQAEVDAITLSEGELGFATDTKKLYIGTSTGNEEVSSNLDLSAVDQDIIPDGYGTRDLGSVTYPFKDLHLVGSTLHLGGGALKYADSELQFAHDGATFTPMVSGGGGASQDLPLGEVISTVPAAVYSKVVDDVVKLMLCDADYLVRSKAYSGFVTEAGVVDDIRTVSSGVIEGFTGLSVGKKYYNGSTPGEIVLAGATTSSSVYVGYSRSATELYAERDETQSDYTSLITSPSDWQATPIKSVSRGATHNLHCQHENSFGKGIRVYQTISGKWYVEFKNGDGLPYQAATTSWSIGVIPADNINNGDYRRMARCFVDESGRGIIGYSVSDANVRWSDDLDIWSDEIVLQSGASDYFVKGIDIRDDKAIILTSNGSDNDSQIRYSTYSAGWGSWASFGLGATSYTDAAPAWCYIQAYPEAIDDHFKYRYVAVGRSHSNNNTYLNWCDVNGANNGVQQVDLWDNPLGVAIDKFGSKNRILIMTTSGGSSDNVGLIATDDFSGAVISVNGKGDPNSGLSVVDNYNGYSTSDSTYRQRHCLAIERRMVVVGDNAYAVMGTKSGTGQVQVNLFRTSNISAVNPTWSIEPVSDGSGGHNDLEYCVQYIASTHSLLIAWKQSSTEALALSRGIIWARLGVIQPNGSVIFEDAVQVDGGELEAGFQGFLQSSSSTSSVSLSWEQGPTSTDAANETWDNNLT